MKRLLLHAAVAGAWIALALLARLQEYAPHASLWFPPAGLAFAVGVMLGWRGVPAILVATTAGSVAGIFASDPRPWDARLWSGFASGLAHALTYVAGARLLVRLGVERPTPQAVSFFLLLAPAAALFASATGLAALVATGALAAADAREAWLAFWIGDAVAVLSLAPLLGILLGGLLDRLRFDPPGRLHVHVQVIPLSATWRPFALKIAACLLALTGSAAVVASGPEHRLVGSFLVFFAIVPLTLIAHTEGALRTYAAIAALGTAIAGLGAALGPGVHEVSYQFATMILSGSALFGLAVPVLYSENRELRLRLTHDSLTGAHTRAHFFEVAERELERSRRFATPLAVAAFDVDHFKAINDRHGHAAGDAVLTEIAARCRRELRSSDALGRLGGEEFALVLPMTGEEAAAETAERLAAVLRDQPVRHGGALLRVTASFGVAVVDLAGETVPDALARADRALYDAKGAGRDRVRRAAPPASGR